MCPTAITKKHLEGLNIWRIYSLQAADPFSIFCILNEILKDNNKL
jgi:hypothetical protein